MSSQDTSVSQPTPACKHRNLNSSLRPPLPAGVDAVEVPATTARSEEVLSDQRSPDAAEQKQTEQVPPERHDGQQLQEGESPDRGAGEGKNPLLDCRLSTTCLCQECKQLRLDLDEQHKIRMEAFEIKMKPIVVNEEPSRSVNQPSCCSPCSIYLFNLSPRPTTRSRGLKFSTISTPCVSDCETRPSELNTRRRWEH